MNSAKEAIDRARSKIYDNLFKRGRVAVWEFYLFRKDGKLVEVEQNIVLLFDRDDKVTGAVGIVRDITERKRVVKELKEAREYSENLFKTSLDGIMIADPQGYITMVNDAIGRMFGYASEMNLSESTRLIWVLKQRETTRKVGN